jgi:hypothetical protein
VPMVCLLRLNGNRNLPVCSALSLLLLYNTPDKNPDEMIKFFLLFTFCFSSVSSNAQKGVAPRPLYDDPVYHGAADPVIIYNKAKEKWWMLYTNRRASIDDSTVQWVHGTRIGIAQSNDGAHWKYVDTCNINIGLMKAIPLGAGCN